MPRKWVMHPDALLYEGRLCRCYLWLLRRVWILHYQPRRQEKRQTGLFYAYMNEAELNLILLKMSCVKICHSFWRFELASKPLPIPPILRWELAHMVHLSKKCKCIHGFQGRRSPGATLPLERTWSGHCSYLPWVLLFYKQEQEFFLPLDPCCRWLRPAEWKALWKEMQP